MYKNCIYAAIKMPSINLYYFFKIFDSVIKYASNKQAGHSTTC